MTHDTFKKILSVWADVEIDEICCNDYPIDDCLLAYKDVKCVEIGDIDVLNFAYSYYDTDDSLIRKYACVKVNEYKLDGKDKIDAQFFTASNQKSDEAISIIFPAIFNDKITKNINKIKQNIIDTPKKGYEKEL